MYMEIHLMQMFITLTIAEIDWNMATIYDGIWVVCAAKLMFT